MFIVYGTPNCAWCDRSKELLKRHEKAYEYVDVSEDEDARTMFIENGYRTVPQVYDGLNYIGGYEKLEDYLTAISG